MRCSCPLASFCVPQLFAKLLIAKLSASMLIYAAFPLSLLLPPSPSLSRLFRVATENSLTAFTVRLHIRIWIRIRTRARIANPISIHNSTPFVAHWHSQSTTWQAINLTHT